ncbi:MAG: NAD/NADP octopine/nopaline dehydrogenase family protein, partial [Vicinamibacteria bacterium]
AMDEEKMDVAGALGLERVSKQELARRLYKKIVDQTGGTHQKKYYAGVKDAPKTVKHRYLVEDMLYGVVPVASLARQIGIPTPALDAVIEVASIVAEENFREEGITMSALGLQGFSREELIAFVEEGEGVGV